MISRETIAKIMDYSRIEEVVGDFVRLKRAGANYKGLCPFHNEKTPSFSVSPAKNIYKCFGCGAAGDPVKFVMEHEKMSYPEALRYLAAKYRIEIEETDTPQEDNEQKTLRESLLIAMKFAAAFYHDALMQSEEGKAVGLSYFLSRGITERTIRDFQLGYAAESSDQLYQSARKSGYNVEILSQAGLIKMKDGSQPYDFFRARVMFPIHNLSGKVVAFGGRILHQDTKQPKYINTPETEIYTKGQLLYGIYQARSEIRRSDVCYLVEGYTDVLSLYQAGIANVVASSGTALTPEQVRLIRRFTFNVVLIYDGDAAGIRAAIRGVDIMLEEGMNVKVVVLPEGEDPDSYVRSQGSDAVLNYIHQNQKDFIFFKSDILLKDAGNDPVKKTNAIRGLVKSIALISDPIRRAYYIRECSKLAELPEQMLVSEVNKQIILIQKNKGLTTKEDAELQQEQLTVDNTTQQPTLPKSNPLYSQEMDLLRVLFQHGHRQKTLPDGTSMVAAEYILQELDGARMINAPLQKILETYKEQYHSGKAPAELYQHQSFSDEDVRKFIIDLQASQYELSKKWKEHNINVRDEEDVWEQDIESAIHLYLIRRISHEIDIIQQQIKQLPAEEFDKVMQLLTQKKTLEEERNKLAELSGTVVLKFNA